MKCNICENDIFIDMNSRKKVQCQKCGSLERTRLLWMYLQSIKMNKESKILHLAPEKGIYKALANKVKKGNYIAADINPKSYSFADKCIKIDLCDLDDQPSFEYDLIIHSHVLEHTPCNIAYTLFHLHRMLKEDGHHLCVIPFMSGKYDECFQDIGNEERKRRFGQFDHVRRFGNRDIHAHLGKPINIPREFDATKSFSEETLRHANIPENHWKGFHISTVLSLKRYDMKFLSMQQ